MPGASMSFEDYWPEGLKVALDVVTKAIAVDPKLPEALFVMRVGVVSLEVCRALRVSTDDFGDASAHALEADITAPEPDIKLMRLFSAP